MIKFKKGDLVKVRSGKDKGREGKIEKIFPKKSLALIPGINMYKKHVKSQREQKGGFFDLPRAIAFPKIAIVCPKCKKTSRVGFKFVDKQKVRICKKCNKEIDTK